MGSLNSQNEEAIRQAWIEKMVQTLDYPRHLVAVEKELSGLPHLKLKQGVPKRRADILVFAKEIHPEHALFPLLMIECKAVPLVPKFAQQVLGYNTFVEAPFVAIANADELMLGYYDSESSIYKFEKGLKRYGVLLEAQMCRLDTLGKVEHNHSLH